MVECQRVIGGDWMVTKYPTLDNYNIDWSSLCHLWILSLSIHVNIILGSRNYDNFPWSATNNFVHNLCSLRYVMSSTHARHLNESVEWIMIFQNFHITLFQEIVIILCNENADSQKL